MNINTTRNILNGTAGIALAGKILKKIGRDLTDDQILSDQEKNILLTFTGQLVQGRTRFAEIDLFRHDILFQESLSLDYVYAPETVRL